MALFGMKEKLGLWGMMILFIGSSSPAWSGVFLTQEEALRLAFSTGTTVERKSLYLTEEQKSRIEREARSKMDSLIVTYYVGVSSSGIREFAFFDSHVVRTMPETLMAVVKADGSLKFVELLAFYEPEDYLPRARWLTLFQDKELNDDLWVKRDIRNVTGATLTTQAITASVRRILAIYRLAVQPTLEESK